MRRLLAVAVLALLSLAACGGDDDGGAIEAGDEGTSVVTEAEAPPTTLPPEESSEQTAPPPTMAEVVVSQDGVTVGDTEHAFGAPAAGVVEAISAVLGEPTSEGDIPECPAGPAANVSWDDDLFLVLQDDAIVGWQLPTGSTLRTDDDLGVGATLGDVQALHPDVTVDEQSTLGIELWVESIGLSGLLTENAPTGTIESLWSGVVCAFR